MCKILSKVIIKNETVLSCPKCMEGSITIKWIGRYPIWECNTPFCGFSMCWDGMPIMDAMVFGIKSDSSHIWNFEYRGYV